MTSRSQVPSEPVQTSGQARTLRDEGAVTAFVVVLLAALLLVAGLVVDGGLALAAKTDAMDAAQEAARSGAQALDLAALRGTGTVALNTDQARQAANAYLASAGYTGTVTVTGTRVTVHVTHQVRTQILQIAGVATLTVDATASAQAQHGIQQAQPDPGGLP